MPSNSRIFKYTQLDKIKNPREGKLAVCFNVDLSSTLTETVDIGLDFQLVSRVRSIYVSNGDPTANLTISVVSTGQQIIVLAGRRVYVPLFSAMPCRLIFTVDVNTSAPIEVIVGNYDFDTFQPVDAPSLTNSIIGEEVPAGVISGTNGNDGNPTFTLSKIPNPITSLMLFKNELKMRRTVAFTYALVAGVPTITYLAGFIPVVGDVHEAYYVHS